jgi:hypothetical protein
MLIIIALRTTNTFKRHRRSGEGGGRAWKEGRTIFSRNREYFKVKCQDVKDNEMLLLLIAQIALSKEERKKIRGKKRQLNSI